MANISGGGYQILKVTIVCTILDIIAVILRFVSRRSIKSPFGADDFWVVIALAFFIANAGVEIWSVLGGGEGFDMSTLPLPTLTILLKTDYISTWLNGLTVLTVKLSILFLYRRVFTTPTFRRITTVIMAVMTLQITIVLLMATFRCLPVESIWNVLVRPTTCIKFVQWFLGALIPSVVFDAIILALPVFMVSRLHLQWEKKVTLAAIFLLGTGSVVAGILRIALVYNPNAIKLDRTKLEVWSTIETGVGIICACLPTYRPIIPSTTSFKSWYRTLLSNRSPSDISDYKTLGNFGSTQDVAYRKDREDAYNALPMKALSPARIALRRSIEVV